MRLTRAFMAGAGASMSLVAAAVSALFVVSAIVTMQGWPGVDPEDDVPRVVLADVPVIAGPTAVPAADRGGRSPAADGPIVLAAARGRVGGRDGADGRRRGGPSRTGPGRGAPGGIAPTGTTTPAGGAAPASGAGQGAAADSSGTVTSGVGGAIRDTGAATGGAVDDAAPGTEGAVRQVTGAVGDAIEDAGGTTDGAVSPLLGG